MQWNGHWSGMTPNGTPHQRARTIVRPTGGIVRGKFPSRKNGRMVHHEGLLELDAIYLFETSPLVGAYREQPDQITYPDGDRMRRYTPDFALDRRDGTTVFVEIKPMRSLQSQEVAHKLDQIRIRMERHGQPFVVLTDAELRQQPRLDNLRTIYHRAPRLAPTRWAMQRALDKLAPLLPCRWTDAADRLRDDPTDIASLLLAGLLRCPLDQALAPESELKLAQDFDDAWFLFAPGHGV